MGTWLKKFWTDEQFFRGAVKSVIALGGALLASGAIPTDQWKYGYFVMALAHLIPSGTSSTAAPAQKP